MKMLDQDEANDPQPSAGKDTMESKRKHDRMKNDVDWW